MSQNLTPAPAPAAGIGACRKLQARSFWLLRYLVVAAVACLIGNAIVPDQVVLHPDVVRDLMLGRELAQDSTLESLGPPSSAGLHHGFLWFRILALVHQAGLNPAILNSFILALFVVSNILVLHFLSRITTPGIALLISGLFLSRAGDFWDFSLLWHPALVPFVFLFILIAMLQFIRESSTRKYLWGGLAILLIGVGSQLHLEVLFLVPGLLVVFIFFRAWQLALALPLTTALLWMLFSRASLLANLTLLTTAQHLGADLPGGDSNNPLGILVMFLVMGSAAVIIGQKVPRFRKELWSLNVIAAAYLASIFATESLTPLYYRYLSPMYPYIFALITYSAAGISQLFRGKIKTKRPRLLLIPVYLYIFTNIIPTLNNSNQTGFTIEDIGTIVNSLADLGLSPEEGLYAIQTDNGNMFEGFANAVWLFTDCYSDRVITPGPEPNDGVLIASVSRCPEDSYGQSQCRERSSKNSFFFIRRWHTFIDRRSVSTCSRTDITPDLDCATDWSDVDLTLDPTHLEPVCHPPGVIGLVHNVIERTEGPQVLRFPLEIYPTDSPHRISTAIRDDRGTKCYARIAGVRGVDHELSMDRTSVLLGGSRKSGQGFIFVEWPTESPECFPNSGFYLQPLLEVDRDIEMLLELAD